MSYKNATHILPKDLLRRVQQYVDGEFLYIPRAAGSKKAWGESTSIRQELLERNRRIYAEYLSGISMDALAAKYYLSLKSIQRIVRQLKNCDEKEADVV